MSANDYMIEALTRHQIFVQRFGGGEVRKILPFLRAMSKKLQARILQEDLTINGMARLNEMDRELKAIIAESIGDIQKQTTLNMIEFGEYEAAFMNTVLDGALTVKTAGVTKEQIRSSITTKPMKLVKGKGTQNLTMQQAFRGFSETAYTDVRRKIQSGIVEGRTTDQIARDVNRLVGSRSRQQADALVRTITNHASATARLETTKANKNVVDDERFVATLDAHTTTACAGFDSQRFPIGEGPHPPITYNCRSTRVPILNRKFQDLQLEGSRPSKGDDGKESVSGKKTYSGFLKDQSPEFQNEVLGKERAKLFRSGDVTLDKFTSNDGVLYSLNDLKAREGLTI